MSHRNKKSNWPRFLCGIQTPSRSLLLQQSRYPLACFYQTAESPPCPCATKHSCGRSVQQRNHYPLASCIYQITWSTSLPTCNQALVWKVGRPAPWHHVKDQLHWQELRGAPVSMFSHCPVRHLCKQRNKTHLFSSGSWNVLHHEPRWRCLLHYLSGCCLLRDTGQLWVTQDEQCHLNWEYVCQGTLW